MATEYRIYDYPGGIAGEDFSSAGSLSGQNGGQYLFVAFKQTGGGDNRGVQDTFVHYQNNYAQTDQRPVGVSQNNPISGGQLAVRCLGRSKITAGGTISVGDILGSDSSGRAVAKKPSQTGANLGDWAMGICSCAAAVGELGAIELVGSYQV